MSIITRFAPSPTGYLHVGNVRTALVNYLLTKKLGGTFLLRFDDTDAERSTQAYMDAIMRDLDWLGLHWAMTFRQSERKERYEEIKEKLLASGRLYPCFETKEELELKRKSQLSRGLAPIYDRASYKLSAHEIHRLLQEGKRPHYRFLLEDKPIQWQDGVRGAVQFEGNYIGDPIVIREDGSMTYLLCSAVDDMDYHITHIVRGEDHVTNTAIHVQMFEAIGHTPPSFAHLALVNSKEAKISKREGGFEVMSLRKRGIDPMAINSFFAKIGTSQAITGCMHMQDLIESFDLSTYGRAPTTYDPEELTQVNHKILAERSYDEAAAILAEHGLEEVPVEFWLAVRSNLNDYAETRNWYTVCYGPVIPEISEPDFIEEALTMLPEGVIDTTTWERWTKALSAKTDRKGKSLFMPLRLALTGQSTGPELKDLLPLIGRERIEGRLRGESC